MLVSDDISSSSHNSINGKDCNFNDEGYYYCRRGKGYDDMIGYDNNSAQSDDFTTLVYE